MQQKRYLILENGKTFEGFAFGSELTERGPMGEVVFTTNMAGFTETVTDPAFAGQVVMQTFPLIGNCGVNPENCESPAPTLAGYVVKERCDAPSHFTCEETLDAYLKRHGVPGIWGIDTRSLTKLIRTEGTLIGLISDDPAVLYQSKADGHADSAMSCVSAEEPMLYTADKPCGNVLLWDFGVRRNTLRWLNGHGYNVTVVPCSWTAAQILDEQADCVLLSGGPGNPGDYQNIIDETKKLLQANTKIFAFGLGHQLLAIANGGTTAKLPYGHRGGCPVKDLRTGRIFITGQNHGFYVNECPKNAETRYTNANDQTCEGLDYLDGNFSAQFEPESCGCTRDTEALMNRLKALLGDQERGRA